MISHHMTTHKVVNSGTNPGHLIPIYNITCPQWSSKITEKTTIRSRWPLRAKTIYEFLSMNKIKKKSA